MQTKKLKCPYIPGNAVQIVQYQQDDNGQVQAQTLIEAHPLRDCQGKQCAAWRRGRCRY